MLAIGTAAGAASFTHVHNVAASHGQPGWLAWADAIVLEFDFPEIFPPERPVVDHDAEWFAHVWLHGFRRRTARTVPVIAVVRELAATLRDDQIPAPQALLALRRAVSLLTVLAESDPNVNRQMVDRGRADLDDEAESNRLLGREAISRPGESTRFAKLHTAQQLIDGHYLPAELERV